MKTARTPDHRWSRALAICLPLAACATPLAPPERMEYRPVQGNSTPVCAIRADPARYIGRRVVIEATRVSDHNYYDYLEDNNCAKDNDLIEIESAADDADASVESFEQDWVKHCVKETGAPFCSLRVHMVVEAEIVAATDRGHLGVSPIGRPRAQIARVTYAQFEHAAH